MCSRWGFFKTLRGSLLQKCCLKSLEYLRIYNWVLETPPASHLTPPLCMSSVLAKPVWLPGHILGVPQDHIYLRHPCLKASVYFLPFACTSSPPLLKSSHLLMPRSEPSSLVPTCSNVCSLPRTHHLVHTTHWGSALQQLLNYFALPVWLPYLPN